MQSKRKIWERFFGVFAKSITWKNLIYLFLTFPFGLFYFILLITLLSLGVGLFILWIGILFIAFGLFLVWYISKFERILAMELLDAKIQPFELQISSRSTFWEKIKTYLAASRLWKGLAFILIKLPIGIIVFTVCVTLLATSLGLIASPFLVHLINFQSFWIEVASLPVSLFICLIGVVLFTSTLHVFNYLCKPLKGLAEAMLNP